jgi:outer membrane protein TolC
MKTISLKFISSLALGATFFLVATVTHAQSVLESYVEEGLKSNLVLQQKDLSLKQAEQSLQVARSYFLPSVNLLADYTSGAGGRSISIPVGDLLNPVYASLNQMMQSDEFPQIENVSQDFFPNNFYDTKIRTSLPLINTDLHMNKMIHGQQVMLKQYEIEAYKRQLVLDIKTAYYNLLSAEAAVKIYESALGLVNKNVEINESLLRNGKSLPANLLRSKSEAERVKSELNSAHNKVKNARSYFNFLLNKDLNSEVNTNGGDFHDYALAEEATQPPANIREELQMLKTSQEINQTSLRMHKFSRLPKVSAFMDLGTQASDWEFNNDSRYYLVGVQLSLPIFNGFRNNINIRQGNLEVRKTEQHIINTERQLALAVNVAENDQQTTVANYLASREQLKSAQSYFNLIEKGYREGVNSLIEYLDARNQLTSSQLQQNLRQFEMLTATARLERETASYSLKN